MTQDIQTVYRQLVVQFGQQGADQIIQSFGQVTQSLQGVNQAGQKTTGIISGIGKTARATSTGVAAFGAGVASVSYGMKALGIDLLSSQRQLFEFNKTLLASRTLFSRQGENVAQTKKRILELKEEYSFTREELLSLQKQFQTGFSYMPIQQMSGYMKFLSNAVGETSSEMANLDQVFQGIGKQIPVFEQMLRGNRELLSGVGQEILDVMYVTGQMDASSYKQASGAIVASNAADMSGDEDQRIIREQLKSVRTLVVQGEDSQIRMAEQQQFVLGPLSKFIEENTAKITTISSTLGNILKLVAAYSAFGIGKSLLGVGRNRLAGRAGSMAAQAAIPAGSSVLANAAGTAGGMAIGSAAKPSLIRSVGGAALAWMGTQISALASLSAATATAAVAAGVGVGLGIEAMTPSASIRRGSLSSNRDMTSANLGRNMAFSQYLEDSGRKEEADELRIKYQRIAELQNKIDKDESSRAGGPLSNVYNASAWMFGTADFRERSESGTKEERKELAELRSEVSKISIETKKQLEAEEKKLEKYRIYQAYVERTRVAMDLITYEVERQDALVSSQISTYESLIQMQSMSGGDGSSFGGASAAGNFQKGSFEEIDKSIAAKRAAIEALGVLNDIVLQKSAADGTEKVILPQGQIDKVVSDLKEAREAGAGISEEMINTMVEQMATGIGQREIDIQRLDLQSQILQKNQEINKVADQASKQYEGQEEQLRAAEGLLGNQVQLANNLAMGVGASAKMIFDQVQAIEEVIGSLNRQKAAMEESYQSRIDATSNESTKRMLEYQMQTKIYQIDGKITAERIKQAGLSKTIRDGWISNISSMMTGEGMFTKIVVDQNTRLGSMMAATGNRTTGVITGFAGRGFENSQKYVAGGIAGDNSGVTSEWQKALTESNPLGSLFNSIGGSLDPAKIAEAMMEWQKDIGSGLGTGAAGAAGSLYGPSELLQIQTDHFKEWGSHGMKVNTEKPLPVIIQNSTSDLIEGVTTSKKARTGSSEWLSGILSEEDKKQMSSALAKEFVDVAKKASRNAIDDLSVGHSRL